MWSFLFSTLKGMFSLRCFEKLYVMKSMLFTMILVKLQKVSVVVILADPIYLNYFRMLNLYTDIHIWIFPDTCDIARCV